MRKRQICPKCDGTDFWVVDPVRQPNYEYSNRSELFRATAPVIDGVRTEAGTFEAWICSGCGFTEWYAKNLEELAYLANEFESGVRQVRGGVPPRGYR